ncbi:hypothetical protein [Leptospira adleri]|uniref:hypothetical protein n=1 Tax=Leptospira adleri TaxID=2023186 RepID=UPI00108488D2|nr:hypothetical protein [Leptospira adleri]TGM60953.1 hypothetical protein EHQ97_02470 [Leptospira adleri]
MGITWESVANAQQYKAMRKALIETAFEQLAIVSDIFFPNTNLGKEKTYQYVEQALTDKNKNTPLSLFDTIGNIYVSEANPYTLSDGIFKFDSNGNIDILNSSYISKLNSSGAHLGVFSLRNFAGLPIVGLDLELGREFLYVSSKNFNFQKTVILKIKTDFSASSFRELDHSNAFLSPQIAVSESKIYGDFVSGDRSSASINYPPVDGGAVRSYENGFDSFFISDIFSLETDNAGHFYYRLTDVDEEFHRLGQILRFDLETPEWKTLDSNPYFTNVHYRIGTDYSGSLYTLDFLTGGFNIVRRDSEFMDQKRIALPRTMNPTTMFFSDSGETALVIDSNTIHRYIFTKKESVANFYEEKIG